MLPVVSDRTAPCPINPSLSVLGSDQASLCLARAFLSPWGGRGNDVITSLQKKNSKKKRDEDASTLPDLFGLLYHDALTCASRRLLVSPPLSLYLLCWLLMPLWFAQKKNHTREMQLLCRFTVGNGRTRFYFLAELYLLFMMDWSLRWVFLVGFCVALCFSVPHNSVSHACTAILRLVLDSDSGRASACTYFVIFFRFSRFSPFAEEGFTCFDHSVMSKKKIRTV